MCRSHLAGPTLGHDTCARQIVSQSLCAKDEGGNSLVSALRGDAGPMADFTVARSATDAALLPALRIS
jgi:hypothetical protein